MKQMRLNFYVYKKKTILYKYFVFLFQFFAKTRNHIFSSIAIVCACMSVLSSTISAINKYGIDMDDSTIAKKKYCEMRWKEMCNFGQNTQHIFVQEKLSFQCALSTALPRCSFFFPHIEQQSAFIPVCSIKNSYCTHCQLKFIRC